MELDAGLCLIRDWRRADAASLLRHADNRRIWRNLTHVFPHPYTAADADAWFGYLASQGEATHWAIAVEGDAVGAIGLFIGEGIHAATAQFGYWLGEACWGRGIATAAVRTVAPYALARFHLHRLEAPVFAWNPASMRVLEKVGFRREGILRRSVLKDGEVIDAVMYALTDADPAASAAAAP